MTADAARVFAEYAASARFEELADDVVERVRLCILDTLACAIAGSSTVEAAAVHRLVAGWAGTPQATVVVHGDRVPAYAAVFANASMVHQHDFDDTHDTAVCHPTSATLTAGLAAAELRGGVSGRELLTAVAVGNDLVARLALSVRGTLWDYPWVRAPVMGIFGAALSAGMVLGLDADGLTEALGLALPQAAGTLQCLRSETSSVRSLRDGLAYKDGMLAALMAAEGLRGDSGTFDGEYGLFNAYMRGEYDRDTVVDALGERSEAVNVSLKPWPSCRHTHGTLTALLDAREGVSPDEIEEIVIHVGDGNARICTPVGDVYQGRMAYLCNLPWVVAAAAAYGAVPLWAFDERGFHDPAIRDAYGRVRVEHDPEQNRHGTIEPGHVVLRLRGGETREEKADRALGHNERPMTRELVRKKARLCAESAATSFDVERLAEAALALDDLVDAGELASLAVAAA